MNKYKTPKPRKDPRISLNELASYLTAGGRRRESIIRGQKYPKDFMRIWYDDASDAIVKFLTGDPDAIDNAIFDLAMGEQKFNTSNCIEALQSFQNRYDAMGLEDMMFSRAGTDAPKVAIQAVDVSVRPELVVRRDVKNGAQHGFLKLHFSKLDPMGKDNGLFATTVMKMWAEETVKDRECHNKLLILVDVFTGQVFTVPNATANRLKDIEAACREIATRWPTL